MIKNERLAAHIILTQVFCDKTPLTHCLKAKDYSPLTKAICFGVCRHAIRLGVIADSLMQKRPKDQAVWIALLIGLYQCHALRIPDYAVVQETVSLMSALKKTWAKGLVNAVLRQYCRTHMELSQAWDQDPLYQHNHPAWFIERVQRDWPNDWQRLLTENNQHPPMTLRVNRQRATRDEYLNRLEQAGLSGVAIPEVPDAIILNASCDVHDLPGFLTGDVSVQDAAAQLAVTLLDLKPGLRVLDACCAPGGKTGHILEAEPNLARCVALDIEPKRLTRVHENLSRLNLTAHIQQGNACHPNTWWDGHLFDRILLDAPCSATGVIRRHPDIKSLRTPADISDIAILQNTLLHALWPLLAKGGLLVYATCSVIRQENTEQLASFILQTSDCEIVACPNPAGKLEICGMQILPGDYHMDGFFYGVLRKK